MSESLRAEVLKMIAPIAGASPTGEDPKYQAEYELVKNEVAKNSDRDFEMVAANCQIVLVKYAKDITVLGYYLLAAASLQKWDTCADVAEAYTELGKQHWDLLHPQRERARINAIKWLNEDRVVGLFENAVATPDDFEHLSRLQKALQALKQLIQEKLPNDTPSIKGLLQSVDQKAKALQPKAAPPAPPPPAPSSAAAAPAAVASAPAPASVAVPVAVGEGASRSDLQKTVQMASLQITACDPEKPLGYVLLRVNRWQDVVQPPKSDAQGKTPFAAPNKQRREFMANMAAQQSWDAILEKSEAAFTEPGFQFWFDLQYYTVQALRGKGRTAIAEAIEHELKALLQRVSQLEQMNFSDGSPFATEATLEWLAKLLASSGGSAAPAQSKAQRSATLADDLAVTEELAAAGKWSEALALLHAGVLHGSMRERTERECVIAELALKASKFRMAFHLAQGLTVRVQERGLADWEPEMAMAIWRCTYKAAKGLLAAEPKAGDLAVIQSMQAQAFAHICAGDPAYASQIS